jgi:hypothetical protein
MVYERSIIGRLSFVERSLKGLGYANPSVTLSRVLNRLGDLRDKKMTSIDVQFIEDMDDLLRRRSAFLDGTPIGHTCACIAGGILFWIIARAPARVVAICTFAAYIISVVLWVVYHFTYSDLCGDGRTSFGKWDGVGVGIMSFGYGWARMFGRVGHRDVVLSGAANLLRPLFGVGLGITVSYGVSRVILRKYMNDILSLCEAYNLDD